MISTTTSDKPLSAVTYETLKLIDQMPVSRRVAGEPITLILHSMGYVSFEDRRLPTGEVTEYLRITTRGRDAVIDRKNP